MNALSLPRLLFAIVFTLATTGPLLACGDDETANSNSDNNQEQPNNQPANNQTPNNQPDDDRERISIPEPDALRDYDGPIGGDRPVDPIFPDNYDVEGNHPLLLQLHGYGSDADETTAGFDAMDLAAELGVVVLAPEGETDSTGANFWNATAFCCNFAGSDVNDVDYLTDLILEAIERYAIDPDRIWLMGISNGGFMSHRMACDRSEIVDAIIPFNGTSTTEPEDCDPTDPVHIIHVHGTEDSTILYDGGGHLYPGAIESIERWREHNSCSDEVIVEDPIEITLSVSGEETTIERWTDCDDGGDVELWTMDGAGHVPLPLANFGPFVFDTLFDDYTFEP